MKLLYLTLFTLTSALPYLHPEFSRGSGSVVPNGGDLKDFASELGGTGELVDRVGKGLKKWVKKNIE